MLARKTNIPLSFRAARIYFAVRAKDIDGKVARDQPPRAPTFDAPQSRLRQLF
jgi:hypothetical protein